jgi:hypothetical protein
MTGKARFHARFVGEPATIIDRFCQETAIALRFYLILWFK